MSQFIYLSAARISGVDSDGNALGLPDDAEYRCRGEATGPNDDPQGFKRMMRSRQSLDVIIINKRIGNPDGRGAFVATRADLLRAAGG